ncbi:MAG TPA: thiamine pyrophosphate-dependent enzyme, partial [Burkholderiales bacterium]|nr:thiamine pyrophosphate-dependent enzyme [Burkholderiales bacterium]
LWTAAHLALPITYVITHNRGYRILKERLVSMRKTDRFVGMDIREPVIDYCAMAASMGVPARRVTEPAEVAPALREALAAGGPRLVEVMVQDGFGT